MMLLLHDNAFFYRDQTVITCFLKFALPTFQLNSKKHKKVL